MQKNPFDKVDEFIAAHIGKPVEGSNTLAPGKKRKRTVLAVGMLTCIFAGIFAADMLSSGTACSENSGNNKAQLIIPRTGESNHSYESQPESFESYQIRILRNQNQLQSEKIKGLREELAELTQKLHELKPHLFKQGDPEDKAKISELNHHLGEKEALITRLTETKQELANELSTAKKKLGEMEMVKEALTSMIEKQRAAKEQNLVNFKKQIEEIRIAAANEKNILLNKMHEQGTAHNSLQRVLAEKTDHAQRLDDAANRLNDALASKEEELKSLQTRLLDLYGDIIDLGETHAIMHSAMHEQAQGLTAALEFEKMQNNTLHSFKEEMNWLADMHAAALNQFQKETGALSEELAKEQNLNAELMLLNVELEVRKQEIAVLFDSHLEYRNAMVNRLNDLTTAMQLEQTRASQLENEMAVLLNQHESSQRHAHALENVVSEMDALIGQKNNDLTSALSHHAETMKALFTHLDSGEMDFEQQKKLEQSLREEIEALTLLHKTKQEALQQELNESYARYENEISHIGELETMLQSVMQKAVLLAEEVAERSNLLEEKDKNIDDLKKSLYETMNLHEKSLEQMRGSLDQEKIISLHLAILLEDAANYQKSLDDEIKEHKIALVDSRSQLETLRDSHAAIQDALNLEIEEITVELNREKHQTLSLQEEIKQLMAKHADEIEAHKLILSHHDSHLTAELDKHGLERRELDARLQMLASQLEQEKENARTLEQELQRLIVMHEAEEQRSSLFLKTNQELSQTLEEKNQLLGLAENKVFTTDYHNAQISKDNQELNEKIALLQQEAEQYGRKAEQIREQDETLKILQAELEERQERIAHLERQLEKSLLDVEKYEAGAELAHEQGEQIKTLQASVQERQEKIDHLQRQLEQSWVDADKRLDEMEGEIEQIIAKYEKSLQHLDEQLTTAREEYENRITEMNQKNRSLENDHQEHIASIEDRIEQTHKEYQQMLQQMQDQNEIAYRDYQEKIGSLEHLLSQTYQNHSLTLADWERKHEQLQQDHQQEIEENRYRYEQALADHFDRHEQMKMSYEQQLAEWESKHSETHKNYEHNLSHLANELEEAQYALNAKHIEHETLMDAKALQHNKFTEMQKKYSEELNKLKSELAQLEQEKNDNSEWEERFQIQERQLDHLSDQLLEVITTNHELTDQVEALKSERKRVLDLEEQLTVLRTRLADREEQVEELQSKLNEDVDPPEQTADEIRGSLFQRNR